MPHYCGIDLHSNNHYVVVIDEEDKRVLEKRLANDLSLTYQALSPYRATLHGIAVESTFNWYWLVDGLQDQGYEVELVNTLAIQQHEGLKYSGDRQDAFHLAHLMRLGILPTGYIYPREQRAIRDLLRRPSKRAKHLQAFSISAEGRSDPILLISGQASIKSSAFPEKPSSGMQSARINAKKTLAFRARASYLSRGEKTDLRTLEIQGVLPCTAASLPVDRSLCRASILARNRPG